MKKTFMLLMAMVMVVMMAAGCGGGEKKKAEAPKVLRVGTEPTFAPFEFQKEGSKEFDGFDMDLIRAIGKQLNMKVEILNMGFDALIPASDRGHRDSRFVGDQLNLLPILKKELQPGDVVVLMGAGNIWKLGERSVEGCCVVRRSVDITP